MGDASSKSATPSKAAAPPAKRGRKSAAAKLAEAETPDSSVAPEDDQGWLPKGKWDKDLKEVSTIQQGRHGEGLFAYLLFNNGKTARVSVQACYDKCPRKVCLSRQYGALTRANVLIRCSNSTKNTCKTIHPSQVELSSNLHSVFKTENDD